MVSLDPFSGRDLLGRDAQILEISGDLVADGGQAGLGQQLVLHQVGNLALEVFEGGVQLFLDPVAGDGRPYLAGNILAAAAPLHKSPRAAAPSARSPTWSWSAISSSSRSSSNSSGIFRFPFSCAPLWAAPIAHSHVSPRLGRGDHALLQQHHQGFGAGDGELEVEGLEGLQQFLLDVYSMSPRPQAARSTSVTVSSNVSGCPSCAKCRPRRVVIMNKRSPARRPFDAMETTSQPVHGRTGPGLAGVPATSHSQASSSCEVLP